MCTHLCGVYHSIFDTLSGLNQGKLAAGLLNAVTLSCYNDPRRAAMCVHPPAHDLVHNSLDVKRMPRAHLFAHLVSTGWRCSERWGPAARRPARQVLKFLTWSHFLCNLCFLIYLDRRKSLMLMLPQQGTLPAATISPPCCTVLSLGTERNPRSLMFSYEASARYRTRKTCSVQCAQRAVLSIATWGCCLLSAEVREDSPVLKAAIAVAEGPLDHSVQSAFYLVALSFLVPSLWEGSAFLPHIPPPARPHSNHYNFLCTS